MEFSLRKQGRNATDNMNINEIEGVFKGGILTKDKMLLDKMREKSLGFDIPIMPKLKDKSKGLKVGKNPALYSYISKSKDFDLVKDNTSGDIYVVLKSRYTKSIENKLRQLKKQYPKLIYNFINQGKIGRKGKAKLKQLHPELKEVVKGSGIFDFLKRGYETVKSKIKETFTPRLDDYNNVSKRTLQQYGNLPIISLNIYRTPIKSYLNQALNLISFGKWDEVRNKYGYDKLFHLALVATVNLGKGLKKNIIMEKNEVVNISTNYSTSPETEVFNVNLNNAVITPIEMLEKARKAVGDTVFFSYDAFYNNCQFFIRYLLDYSDLYNNEAKEFLFQDLTELVREIPGYIPTVAKIATDTGAVISKLRGEGIDKKPINRALGKTLVMYRGRGTEEGEQVKALSRGVVGLAENIPGIGTAVKALSKPITMATDAFTDYVLEPLFFDTPEARKRKEVKDEWADYIKDKSMRRYGVELTPEQFREINQEEKTLKTQAKNIARSKGIEDFEKIWRDAGFKSAGEYRQAQRKARTEELRKKKLTGNGKSPPIPRKYLDEADKVYERPSLYRSSYAQKLALENDPEYKKKYEEYLKTKGKKEKGGLARWYKEEWINVKEYLKGKKVVCGSFKETRERPACRPLIRINEKTPITLPELLEKGVTKERILQEITKKEKNPDYRINWNKLN